MTWRVPKNVKSIRYLNIVYHLESKESMEASLDIWRHASEHGIALLFPEELTCWLIGAPLPMCDNQFESCAPSSSFSWIEDCQKDGLVQVTRSHINKQ